MIDQSANTNRTRTEHVYLSDIAIWSKELAISIERLDNTIIHTNQAISSIDRQGNSEWDMSFGSRKSCNKMSIDFGRNMHDDIYVNPPIIIGIIRLHITSLKSGTGIGFGRNIGDGIPPINI